MRGVPDNALQTALLFGEGIQLQREVLLPTSSSFVISLEGMMAFDAKLKKNFHIDVAVVQVVVSEV